MLFLSLILTSSYSLVAQSRFTLQANLSSGLFGFSANEVFDYSQYGYSETHIHDAKIGVGLGLELVYKLSERINISSALGYQYYTLQINEKFQFYDDQKIVYFENTIINKHQLQTIQLPIHTNYVILDKKMKLAALIGFTPSLLVFSKFHYFEDEQYFLNLKSTQPTVSFENRIDFIVSAGLSLSPNERFELRMVFEKDLKENNLNYRIFDEDVWLDYDYEFLTTGLQLEVSYKLQKQVNNDLLSRKT